MIDVKELANLVPLDSLGLADRSQIARQARVVHYRPGQIIFDRGDRAVSALYLLAGEVELVSGQDAQLIRGGSDASRYALDPGQKRTKTCMCLKAARVLIIDREYLDVVLTWSQAGDVEVSEGGGAEDWMSALLALPTFAQIPPANLGLILASMDQVRVPRGDYVIREGDEGDYFYVLISGSLAVVRIAVDTGKAQGLAKLMPGECFGEEALVSGLPRNASVRALEDSVLARLTRERFKSLLVGPNLREVDIDDVADDSPFIDVRLPAEYARGHMPAALNLPLQDLRRRVRELDRHPTYTLYCDTGRRSAAAAYVLGQMGFQAQLIRGGIEPAELAYL